MTSRGPGEAVLFLYRLKPGMGPEYDCVHRAVWPEILDLIDEAGIYDYQIWRHGDLVVSRMRTRQGYDHAGDLADPFARPLVRRARLEV